MIMLNHSPFSFAYTRQYGTNSVDVNLASHSGENYSLERSSRVKCTQNGTTTRYLGNVRHASALMSEPLLDFVPREPAARRINGKVYESGVVGYTHGSPSSPHIMKRSAEMIRQTKAAPPLYPAAGFQLSTTVYRVLSLRI